VNAIKTTLARSALAGVIAGMLLSPAYAAEISGAGATFPYPIYAKWAEAFKAKTGISMNYQSIGSGGGIKQIEAKTVDFGASDVPLTPDDLQKNGLTQFPMIMGGIVPVLNVKGVEPGKLKLTGPILANIFLGTVTKWNDKQIADLNKGVSLPDQAIAVVHRSDGSGTTYNFADYLAKISSDWKSKVGVNTALEWPTGLGGKGNEGVAALVSRTDGAIGYVEYAYAKQNKMSYALVQNKDHEFPQPSNATFQAAAANADWAKAPGFFLILTDQPGKQSWPITATSFILMQKVQDKPESGKQVLAFFDWAYRNGQKLAEELDYVPFPDSVVKLVEDTWKQEIKGADGKPVWSGPSS
jgi:phosphate transport system substrate-binding protein